MAIGRPGGALRIGMALVALVGLLFLAVTLARMNVRLEKQQRANLRTLELSHSVVAIDEDITARLRQLEDLVPFVQQLLDQLASTSRVSGDLVATASQLNALVESGAAVTERGSGRVREIAATFAELERQLGSGVQLGQELAGDQDVLLRILRAVVADLEAILGDAITIRRTIVGGPG